MAKQVQFSEEVLTAGNECVGVLLASVEPSGQLMEAVLVYGLDQLDCCQACSSEYNLSVLILLTVVPPVFHLHHSHRVELYYLVVRQYVSQSPIVCFSLVDVSYLECVLVTRLLLDKKNEALFVNIIYSGFHFYRASCRIH